MDRLGMLTVRSGTYVELHADIRTVRDAVFLVEQAVPPAIEEDDRDPHCIHVVAYEDGEPLGTGRLDEGGRVGRVAVLAAARRRGVGRRVMAALEDAARARGLSAVHLHAQEGASDFYRALGYAPHGEFFYEAGIPHRRMRKDLVPDTDDPAADR